MKGIAQQQLGKVALVKVGTALLDCRGARYIRQFHFATCAIWLEVKSKVTGFGSYRIEEARARRRSGSMASSCVRACSRYPRLLYAQKGICFPPGSRNSLQHFIRFF